MKRQTGKYLESCRVVSGRTPSTRADGFNGMFRVALLGLTPDVEHHYDEAVREMDNECADQFTILNIMCSDGEGWDHVSVSIVNAKRCPTWEEMCAVKDLFFDEHETVIQFHPAKANYRNCHPFCLHLWRPQNAVLPVPDPNFVAPIASPSEQAYRDMLMSFDPVAIRNYFAKSGRAAPGDDVALLAGVCKGIMQSPAFHIFDERDRARAQAWLHEHGMSERITS